MREEYDFSAGRKNPYAKSLKRQVTINIDSATIDYPGWKPEDVAREVDRACRECGKLYFIPGASQGLAMSTFPGVYEETSRQIDLASKKYF